LIDVREKVNCKAIKQNLKRRLRGETNASDEFVALTLITQIADVQKANNQDFPLDVSTGEHTMHLRPMQNAITVLMIH